jgi:hypothetical protein
MDLEVCSSSGRAAALQAETPEFELQSHQKKKKKKNFAKKHILMETWPPKTVPPTSSRYLTELCQ